MDAKEYAIANFEKYSIQIPEHIVDGFRLYLTHGRLPGSFCMACLCNDLKEASGKADHINKARLADIGLFMYWGMPTDSQGGYEKVKLWASHSGLSGIDKFREEARGAEEVSEGTVQVTNDDVIY